MLRTLVLDKPLETHPPADLPGSARPWMERALGGARDRLARRLLRNGILPNHLTVAGAAATLAAGCCLAVGAGHRAPWEPAAGGPPISYWPLVAGAFLLLAAMMDVLDGATARVGKGGTAFGGILDSTLDRLSDMLVFGGCALHFAHVGNVTFVLLALLGMVHAMLISYIKARAECVIDDCEVGFWLRPERVGMAVVGCLTGHVPALLVHQAFFPAFTVWRRLRHARRVCGAWRQSEPVRGRVPPVNALNPLFLWRFPRGTLQYAVMGAANAAFILCGPWVSPFLSGGSDPLRRLISLLHSP